MTPMLGQIALGVYAVLLAVGGSMGYKMAGSKPSLIAGLASAGIAGICLILALTGRTQLGFVIGAVLAGVLTLFFGSRFAQARKFMPGGLMTVASLIVASLLAALAVNPTVPEV